MKIFVLKIPLHPPFPKGDLEYHFRVNGEERFLGGIYYLTPIVSKIPLRALNYLCVILVK
jgi:hypothetical protein